MISALRILVKSLVIAISILFSEYSVADEPSIRPLTPFDPDPQNPQLEEMPWSDDNEFLKLHVPIEAGHLRITAWRNLHDPSKTKDNAPPKKVELLVVDTKKKKAGWLQLILGQKYGGVEFTRLDYRSDTIGDQETGLAAVLTTDLSLRVVQGSKKKQFVVLRTFLGRSGHSVGFFSETAHPIISTSAKSGESEPMKGEQTTEAN